MCANPISFRLQKINVMVYEDDDDHSNGSSHTTVLEANEQIIDIVSTMTLYSQNLESCLLPAEVNVIT